MQCVLVGGLHEESAENRREDAESGHRDRHQNHAVHAFDTGVSECAERHRSDDRTDVRLEQVGAHARDVTDVVANVVSDRARVAGVIFRNAFLNLTDEVCTDVCRLREDAAAHAREQRDGGGAEAEAEDFLEATHGELRSVEQREASDADEGETDNAHAHHDTRAERHVECS